MLHKLRYDDPHYEYGDENILSELFELFELESESSGSEEIDWGEERSDSSEEGDFHEMIGMHEDEWEEVQMRVSGRNLVDYSDVYEDEMVSY